MTLDKVEYPFQSTGTMVLDVHAVDDGRILGVSVMNCIPDCVTQDMSGRRPRHVPLTMSLDSESCDSSKKPQKL